MHDDTRSTMSWPEIARWRKSERERLIAARLAIPAEERASLSTKIAHALDAIVGDAAGKSVSLYWPFRGEPDLRPLDWAEKKTVLIPRVDGENLVFHAVSDATQLKPGAFGVMEPDPAKCHPVDPREADLIFVPGLAFTTEGLRLGRGRGFYDRLLASLPPEILRVGACFPEQIVSDIPCEPHDEEVDVVLST